MLNNFTDRFLSGILMSKILGAVKDAGILII